MTNFCRCFESFCEERRSLQLLREIEEPHNHLIDFSSNDYLGLSTHPELINAAMQAATTYGVGATGSRLLSGNKLLYSELEHDIAHSLKTEDALIFQSGYQANSTALAALVDSKVLKHQAIVFFDKANHASLYPPLFLQNVHLVRYRHIDMDDLEHRLCLYQHDPRPKFIVTETLFGMDGDCVDVARLLTLARRFKAFVYLDEAHAIGVYGPYGLAQLQDTSGIDIAIMGTFSKAIGTSGAFLACQKTIQKYLVNKCAGFIYSTAPSPLVIAAAHAAWKIIPKLSSERTLLLSKSAYVRKTLLQQGWNIIPSSSHIICMAFKEEKQVMKTKRQLLTSGILVSAIRPPTAPTPRIRIAIRAPHSEEDIEQLITALGAI
jgi:8-amino-7-oxononanoate synthase